MSDLTTRAARGTAIMAGATVTYRVLHLASLIYLARVLMPKDFGLIALCQIIMVLVSPFSALGMRQAVIHSPEPRPAVAFHGFVVSVGLGVLFSLLVAANAPIFAMALGDDETIPLLRFLSTMILLDSLSNVPEALLEKQLRFGRFGALRLAGDLTYIAAAIAGAAAGLGVWSLATGHLARSTVKLALSWTLCPGWEWLIPKRWDSALVGRLSRYAVQTVGSSFLALFNSHWDNYIVGRLLGATALGFYGKAYDFVNLIKAFNEAISRVLFPSYTRIQDQRDRLARAYLQSLQYVSLLTVPAAVGILAVAPVMVPALLGDKWLPMIPALQILSIMGIVRPLSGTTSPLFLSVGKPNYNIRVSLVHLGIMVAGVLLLLRWGIEGMAVAVALAYGIGFCFNIYQVETILPGTARRIPALLLPTTLGSTAMGLTLVIVRPWLMDLLADNPITTLAMLVPLGASVYAAVLFVSFRPLLRDVTQLLTRTARVRGEPS